MPENVLWIFAGIFLIGIITESVLLILVITHEKQGPAEKSDVILVLGAQHRFGKPNRALQGRIRLAGELYQKGYAPKILLSGGIKKPTRSSVTEASLMRQGLLELGVPETDTLMEDKSNDTVWNIRNSKRIMSENGWESAVLITNGYHMFRALLIAKREKLPVIGVAVEPQAYRWFNRFRETLGLCKLLLYILFRI